MTHAVPREARVGVRAVLAPAEPAIGEQPAHLLAAQGQEGADDAEVRTVGASGAEPGPGDELGPRATQTREAGSADPAPQQGLERVVRVMSGEDRAVVGARRFLDQDAVALLARAGLERREVGRDLQRAECEGYPQSPAQVGAEARVGPAGLSAQTVVHVHGTEERGGIRLGDQVQEEDAVGTSREGEEQPVAGGDVRRTCEAAPARGPGAGE